MLNENKNYKELVEKAEIELNSELNNIKNGNMDQNSNSKKSLNESKSSIDIEKNITLIDEKRKIYMVTVFAKQSDKKITLQGYEKFGEYE